MITRMAERRVQSGLYLLKLLLEDGQETKVTLQSGKCKLDAVLRLKMENFRENNSEYKDLCSFFDSNLSISTMLQCNEGSCRGKLEISVDQEQTKLLKYFDDDKKLYTVTCISLLNQIHEAIQDELSILEKCNPKDHPGIILGANDKKIVTGACQFITSLGIYLHLKPGVCPLSSERSVFWGLLEEEKGKNNFDETFLFLCTKSLCRLLTNLEFGHIIMTKSLEEIFGALVQIGFKSEPKDTVPDGLLQERKSKMNSGFLVCRHQREWCRNQLNQFLDSFYQPLVIRTLLVLQGFGRVGKCKQSATLKYVPPRWMQKICSKLLSKKLMEKNGLQTMLQVIFDEYSIEGKEILARCDVIGYLVSNCPLQAHSLEEYYKIMSSQILQLIELKGNDEKTSVLYQQVVSSCISWMVKKDSRLTKRLILKPVLNALYVLCHTEPGNCKDTVVSEEEMTNTIEATHKIVTLSRNPEDSLVGIFAEVCQPMFEIYAFLKNGISHLKLLTQEVIFWLLHNVSPENATEMLFLFLTGEEFVLPDKSSRRTMLSGLEFRNGKCGGICVVKASMKHSVDDLFLEKNVTTEHRIVAILELLKDSTITGNFFVSLLEELTIILSRKRQDKQLLVLDETVLSLKLSIPIVSMIAAICDKLGNNVLQEPKQVLSFIKGAMECYLATDNYKDLADTSLETELRNETLEMALNILSLILTTSNQSETDKCEGLDNFIELLQKIENASNNDSIQRTANDLRVLIGTRGAVNKKPLQETMRLKEQDVMSNEAFDTAMIELIDPLIPTRGHAILHLALLLENKNPKATENGEKLLSVFMDNLSHDDSFIYLSSVRALASLSAIQHQVVIPVLAKEFAMFVNKSVEEKADNGLYFKGADANRKKFSPERRMKIGEALMKSIQSCGPVFPRYSQVVLASLLTGVKDDDSDVRASSLSNIGDTCKLLRFAVGPVISEIMNCIRCVLQFDECLKVKRAAVRIIKLLLEGLQKDVFQAIGDTLKDIYHILKTILNSEKDDVTLKNARSALGELDSVMKQFLFPKVKLEKKICVLKQVDNHMIL